MDVLVMGSHVLEKQADNAPRRAPRPCTSASSKPAPTGQTSAATDSWLTELSEDLVRLHGWDVTVVAGYPLRSASPLPAREWRNAVQIVRAAGSTIDQRRSSAAPRTTSRICVSREMLQRHDAVILYMNGIRYLMKAPLHYWAVAASYGIFGRNEFATRLPVALAMIGLALSRELRLDADISVFAAGLY